MAKQGKNKTLLDLPQIVKEFAEKTTIKRFDLLRPRLQELAEKEADYLFKYMVNDLGVFGATANPFRKYSNKPWKPLNKKYAKYKGTNAFWLNEKKRHLLRDWFATASPNQALGKPYVYMSEYHPRARGLQNVKLTVRMFPREKMDAPTWVLDRLFGLRPAGDGYGSSRISNEEDRPILSPAMQQLVNYRINRKIKNLIKDTLENG